MPRTNVPSTIRGLGLRGLALAALAGTALTALAGPAAAVPPSVTLSGDYLRIGFNYRGTLGTGGTVRPGILYDGTGTGTFTPNYDYLTPGSPMEGFVVQGSSAAGAFTATNNNASLGGASISGVLTDYSGVAYGGTTFDRRVVWTGTYGSLFTITHDYHFNTGGQQLSISTTITALTDLSVLSFTRFEDPDAVAAPGDTSATNNFQGSGSIAGTDLIYAEATVSRYVIGFYSTDPTPHRTGAPGFTANPTGYLNGTFLGNGDYTIGMGFTIGALANGASLNLNYSYIFGTNIAAAVLANTGGGGADAAPVPTNIEADHSYSLDDLTSGRVNPVFDGGVLTLGATAESGLDLMLMPMGGGIDTATHDLTLSGVIAGEGRLSKLGAGMLTLTGANTFRGVTVEAGVLAFDADEALGAATSEVTVGDGGGLRALADLTVRRRVQIDGGTAGFDTMANTVTLAGGVGGAGALAKTGSGMLTLEGVNSFHGLTVDAGVLAFAADDALGAADGAVTVADGASLRALGDLDFAHRLAIGAGVATFDTMANNVLLSGDVAGGGTLRKTGAGLLTLTGANSQATLDIQSGRVAAGSQAALGAADGRIVLHTGAAFAAADDLTITQAVDIAGDDSRFDTGAHQVTLGGPVSGTGCFTKVGAGRLNLTGAGANAIGACVMQGQLSFNNVFAGNVYVDPGAQAGGGGLIAGAVSVRGVLAPGNSPGRLVVMGAVTQEAGSTLAIDIDGPTPGVGAGHYDTLVLAGPGSRYTAGGTLAPITRGITGDAANSYTPRIGDTFQVVTAEGGVAGAFATVAQPASGLAANSRFEVIYTPTTVILAVTPDRYAALATGVLNAQAVGAAADALRARGSNSFTSGLVGLNEAQLAATLHAAAGEIHADGLEAMLNGNRSGRVRVSERMRAEGDRGVWAEATAGARKVGSDAAASGYRVDRTGVMIGLDRQLTPALLAGVAVSYGEGQIKAGAMGSGRTLSYQALAYAGWRSGASYLDGVAAAGSDTYKAVRSVTLSTGRASAYAKPHGRSYAVDLEVGRRFAMGPAAVTLAAGVGKDRLTRDGLVETGDAVTALRIDDVTRSALQGRVGVRASRRMAVGAMTVTPFASAFVLREFDGARSRLDANLQGSAFEVASTSPGRTSVLAAVGVNVEVSRRARIGFGYRYEGAREADSHAVNLTGSLAW